MGYDHNHISRKFCDAGDLEHKHHPRTRVLVPLRDDRERVHVIVAQENPTGGMGALRHLCLLHDRDAVVDLR